MSAYPEAADMANKKSALRLGKKLGASIAERRGARKWTQEELAERLGVAAETISRFERGATLPSLLTLQELAQILRTPISDLLGEVSSNADDQAAAISKWISDLHLDDREYVVAVVKRATEHLRGRR